MNLFKLIPTGIILILLIAGCTREDPVLNDPVRMPLALSFTENDNICEDTIQDGWVWDWDFEYCYFAVTGGYVAIQKIEFEGMRESGGLFFFENYPSCNFSCFKNLNPPPYNFTHYIDNVIYHYNNDIPQGVYEAVISNYDIPQGVYDYFRWDIYLKEIETEEWLNDEIESLHAGLVIKGIYQHGYFSLSEESEMFFSMPFILVIDDTEKFCFRTLNKVVIEQSKTAQIYLLFNWSYVFNSISHESFEGAKISGDSLDQRIIISSSKNSDLYEMLLYRLGISTKIGIIKGGIPISSYNDISGTH